VKDAALDLQEVVQLMLSTRPNIDVDCANLCRRDPDRMHEQMTSWCFYVPSSETTLREDVDKLCTPTWTMVAAMRAHLCECSQQPCVRPSMAASA